MIMQYSFQSTSVWVVPDREREGLYLSAVREEDGMETEIESSGTLSPSGGPIGIVALLTHTSQT